MIQGFGQEITEIPAFGHDITEVRAMGQLAWQKQSSIPDYLCFTALEAGQFTLTIPAAVTATYLSYVEWSKDGRIWTHTDNTSEAVTIDVQVASGEKVYWRGSGICTTAQNVNTDRFAYFSSDCRFGASGNISSMLKGDGILDHLVNRQTSGLTNVTFANLFNGCTTLVNAADMVLPTFTSYYTYIYYSLFRGCAALVSAPALPSTELANSCYFGMFYGCTSITTSPTLPALTMATNCYYQMYYSSGITEMPLLPSTALADSCYREMFRNCASLTTLHELPATILAVNCYRGMFYASSGFSTAPDLPATTLVDTCYANMFYNCRLLNHVKCLATDISASNCLINWLGGVSSTGTFIQASGVTWPRGASGIPTGWVDVEKRTMPSGYKQVEYLQGMGASRINLGIQFQKNIRILQDITYLSQNIFSWGMNAKNYEVIWGPRNDMDNFYFGLGRSNDGRKWTPNTYYEFDYDFTEGAMVAKVNNEIYRQTTGSQPTRNTIYLFCYNNFETDLRDLYMRSQYFKLYMNGVLTKDLVASVRESDGMVGFYDFVNDTLLTSDTDTPFTAGEEI